MSTYTVQSPGHAGAAITLIAPTGLSSDVAPTGVGNALMVVNGATPTTVTLTPPAFDGLTVGTRTVSIAANTPYLIPLPRSVYGAAPTAVGYGNITTLAGGATGVAVVNIPQT